MTEVESTRAGTGTSARPSVKVFGSAVVRVVPDTASINVGVSRVQKEPRPAFDDVRGAARAVGAFLRAAGVDDVGTSRITLAQETRYVNGEHQHVGYRARIGFSVVLRDLDRVEDVLAGLVGAGANELTSVEFQTTRLKDVRADARRRAVAAARQKAELYCGAAGVTAGRVLAIEDVSPDVLSGRSEGHSYREPAAADDSSELKAVDPGSITVAAAVNVVYEITP